MPLVDRTIRGSKPFFSLLSFPRPSAGLFLRCDGEVARALSRPVSIVHFFNPPFFAVVRVFRRSLYKAPPPSPPPNPGGHTRDNPLMNKHPTPSLVPHVFVIPISKTGPFETQLPAKLPHPFWPISRVVRLPLAGKVYSASTHPRVVVSAPNFCAVTIFLL